MHADPLVAGRTGKSRRQAEHGAKLEALHDKLTAAVSGLVTGEDWRRALEFAARFRTRSFNNTLLIYAQHAEAYEQGRAPEPTPTYVAAFKQWLSLGRRVTKGQSGYQILAPVTARFASVLMAEGGGTGITTMPVLQSLSQARDKWGDHAAGAIWDATIVKIILGGTSAARDLQDLSALIGERDEHTDTISIGDHGSRSLQRSTRRIPVMPPETIRTLPLAPDSCSCAVPRQSLPTCARGPDALTPQHSSQGGPRSRLTCKADRALGRTPRPTPLIASRCASCRSGTPLAGDLDP